MRSLTAMVGLALALGCGGTSQSDMRETSSGVPATGGAAATGGAPSELAPAAEQQAGAGGSKSPTGGSLSGGASAAGAPARGGSPSAGMAGVGSSGGSQSGSAHAGQAGSDAGSGGAPDEAIDPCDVPADAALTIDRDGLCGPSSSFGKYCSLFGFTTSGTYILASDSGAAAPGCACDWVAFRVPANASNCARLTIQDGATARMSAADSCAEDSSIKSCVVLSGMRNNTAEERYISVSRPSTPAWFLYETTPLVAGECPLECP